MRISRTLVGLSSLAVAASAMVGLVPTSSAEPGESGTSIESTEADETTGRREPAIDYSAAVKASAAAARAAARSAAVTPGFDTELTMPSSYPFQPQLTIYPDNVPDGSDTRGVLGHDDLAPMLMDWMQTSNRISTQVVGQSSGGRDLYLVTVTAPESASQTAQQAAWKSTIKNSPAQAATDTTLKAGYKTPIWFSANIHGNEWEGTDASMQYIDELVSAPWQDVKDVLRDNRLYFTLTINPDGRTLGQRPGLLNLDINRDMITGATPESVSFAKTAEAIQPIYSADIHGYTGVLQVEPCGPPHGENYEYDLFIPHGYAMARRVEDDVVAANIPGNTYRDPVTGGATTTNTGKIIIPFRDTPSGWDDFPPVFTAQYAAYFGAVTSTVELPLGRSTNIPLNKANSLVDVAVAKQTITSMVDYFTENTDSMLANQIEIFRRGDAGEPKTSVTTANIASVPGPSEWKSLWDVADDQDPVSLPRAYVIPVGATQRSTSDAATLVRHLLFNDIEVGTLNAATTVGGTTYAKGSYVVDMHQPLRGLANALLDLGTDISLKVPSMYDISAWSYSYLWGATVDKVGSTTGPSLGSTTPITAPTAAKSVPATPDFVTFDVAGIGDVQALNALLEEGVKVSMLADGSAVVGPEAYADVVAVATDFDIAFTKATAADLAALDDATTKGLQDLTIAYTGTQDDKLSLIELGFDDLVPVTAATITATPSIIDDADLMWLGSGLAFTVAQQAGKDAVQAWVNAGHSIVGRGASALTAASTFGLMTATSVAGNGSGNGIVAIDTPASSPLAPYSQKSAFIYPAVSFTGLGANTRAEQTYGVGNPLLAGHWRSTTATNGPLVAGGQASVISGRAATGGAKALVFGTSVFFRTHPKGGMSQAARALFWASQGTAGVVAPSTTSVTVVADATVAYPGTATFNVLVASPRGVPAGTLTLVDQASRAVVASGPVANGSASLKVAGLLPGTTTYAAVFAPSSPVFEASSSTGVTLTVTKAVSTTTLRAKKVGKVKQGRGKVKITVGLAVPGLPSVGTITIRDKGAVLQKFSLAPGDKGKKALRLFLSKGKHKLTATYVGTSLIVGSTAKVTIKLK